VSGSDPYVYPNSKVLRNKRNFVDATELDYVERELVVQRIAEGAPTGRFDLDHLRAIHKHLFQDIYDWAGELRRVELAKDGNQFQFRRFIETGMADVHGRLERSHYLKSLTAMEFAAKAGEIIGDVNYVHPFREGNGRTQLEYLRLLAQQAGHPVDLSKIDAARWLAASKAAHRGNYEPFSDEILAILILRQAE